MSSFKDPYSKMLPSCQKSDQNIDKDQSYKTFIVDLKFLKGLNQLITT